MDNSNPLANRNLRPLTLIPDPLLDRVFRRTLTYAAEQAADIDECFLLASGYTSTDRENWLGLWSLLAAEAEATGRRCLRAGNKVSAREAFLRASNYFRASSLGQHPSGPRARELWIQSVDCFARACPLFAPPIEALAVAIGNRYLPGYFWRPDGFGLRRPTLIAVGGTDCASEELVLALGTAAVRRNMNFVAVDFPGQRGILYRYPDWVRTPDSEPILPRVLDHVTTMAGVDDRIAVLSLGFGSYEACRGVDGDRRVKGLVAVEPVVGLQTVADELLQPLVRGVPRPIRSLIARRRLSRVPAVQAIIEHELWSCGYDVNCLDVIGKRPFAGFNANGTLSRLTCPTLVVAAEEGASELVQQSRRFHEQCAAGRRNYYLLGSVSGGDRFGLHPGNLIGAGHVVFDWLSEVFGFHSEPVR